VRGAHGRCLTAGSTSVNQAPVTGESLPVDKAVGDPVFAGTINDTGSFEFGSRRWRQLDAGAHHPRGRAGPGHACAHPGLRRPLCGGLHPGGLRLRVAVAVLTPWLLGWSWMQALYKALVLLVIACPCALVISTPVTIVSGLAPAARRGILIKGGVYLEGARAQGHRARQDRHDHRRQARSWWSGEVLHVAGGPMDAHVPNTWARVLAGHSDHPVSQAIARARKGPTA
jgi:Cd2+/Zn2+-exporting ATPase